MGPFRRLAVFAAALIFGLIGLAYSQDPVTQENVLGAPENPQAEPLPAPIAAPPIEPFPLVATQGNLPGPIDVAPPSPTAVLVLTEPEAPRVRPRLTVREDTGDGVTYTRGFIYAEGFLPLWQAPGNAVFFVDGRAVNFFGHNLWEWNAGIGARWKPSQLDWVFGINSFFDWRDTGNATFRQITVGLEAMGPFIDLRGNIYSPVGPTRRLVQDGGFSNPQFTGFNILLDRTLFYENAMRGFDLEVGAPVPYMDRWGVRAYAGYYHYESSGAPYVDGARARLEAQVSDHFSLHLQVQNDRVFNTTVQGGVAFHLGSRRPVGASRTPVDRLGQRVVRDPNVVVARTSEITKETALDPVTGLPIIVRHVSSSADANGNGTFERPYQTLEKLEANAQPGDILFAHVNSIFSDQFIILRDRQRLLGEGIAHQIVTTQGVFNLPNRPGNAPMIFMTCGCSSSITLANNNEVSGFAIDLPDGFAILGDTITNFNINRNTFTNPGAASIFLIDAGGTGVIANNVFGQTTSNPSTYGFQVIDSTGTLRLTIANNTTFGHTGGAGLFDLSLSSSSVIASLTGNRFNDTSTGLTAFVSDGKLGLHLQNNASVLGYDLTQSGGTFLLADTLGTNTGPFTLNGGIVIVPLDVLNASFP